MPDPNFSEVRLETLPALKVASYRVISNNPEEEALQYIGEWLIRHGLPKDLRTFGFDVPAPEAQRDSTIRGYEVWVAVPPQIEGSESVIIKNFTGGLFAALTIYQPFQDPFAKIPAGWRKLHEWVQTNTTYKGRCCTCLEEVVEAQGAIDMIIYYGIQPRNPAGVRSSCCR